MAQGYPRELGVGRSFSVTIGINNDERAEMSYGIVAGVDGDEIGSAMDVLVQDVSSKEVQLEIIPTKPQEDAKVEFMLLKSGDTAPYRAAYLWIDMKDKDRAR